MIFLKNTNKYFPPSDPVMKRGTSDDMIYRPVLFIAVKCRITSCLDGGIFICCPFMLHIPHTFHIPLSPNPVAKQKLPKYVLIVSKKYLTTLVPTLPETL